MERFGETWKLRGKMKATLGIKTKLKVSWEVVGFLREKLEQVREFKSEDFQEQNNERIAREWQYNQLITQNQQIQAYQSQTIRAL